MKLNLGCGNNYLQGYINVDRVPGIADTVHDLDKIPYPWPDNSADEILMRHVLEHLQDVRKVMDELWRLLKPGGSLVLYVPHFSHFQALTHPEHRHAFITTLSRCLRLNRANDILIAYGTYRK